MSKIEVIDHTTLYENPIPHIRSRHAYFPGLVQLPNGDLLALFTLGEAMDSTDMTTVVSRSHDQGRTWSPPNPLHERDPDHQFDSDYLKPTVLRDGSLIATGYHFYRTGRDMPITNPETDGVRSGDNLVSFSLDEGFTWSPPSIIPTRRPELVEASGPCLQLRDGRLLVAGSLFPTWEGTHPSSHIGVLLSSRDQGRTWDDNTVFYHDPKGQYMPAEPRLCEMQDGRVVALFWTHGHVSVSNLPNHLTVSHDGGITWSEAIDTGVAAQASNLMYMGGDYLLTIHCHREGEVGLVVRIVDFADDQWRVVAEATIWDNAQASKVAAFGDMAKSLKFGQASLLRLDNGDIIATHWAVVDGRGRILTHRLRVNL